MARIRSRIMVVGRDVAQRARVARLLNGAGYGVEIAEDASHARRIGFNGIAMAIVAPDEPGPEGRGLVEQMRAAIGNVLLFGGPDASDEAGLLARVGEALAPISEPERVEPVLAFGTYRLDLAGHSLSDATGKEVPLTHGEYALLRVFVQRPGRVLSRDQLLQLLSGRGAEAYDRSIDMQIVRLRRKIEPDPRRPTLIVTVPNSGYKFAVPVTQGKGQEPGAPDVAPGDPERRHVTALAAEMLAADGSKLPDDPEELRVLIDAWRRYAAVVVARHGGVLAAPRVREVLAYFGYPVAQEHAAEGALHAALALAQREPEEERILPPEVAVRVGVASGLVIADPSGEVLGETPAEAISMQALAEPGQVVAAASAQHLGGDQFAYRELGPLAVKSRAGPVRAWQVLGPGAHASRSEALYAGATMSLIGRDEELSALLRAWRHAASGKGRLVLLTGEPGIGKSRLLAALEESLAAEKRVSQRYFCSPLHRDSTLHPIVARWEQEAGFARGDSPETRLRKLEAIVAPAALSSEDVAAIAAMLSVPAGDRYRWPELNARQRMERTFAALLRRLEGVARN
jgi:DNA-binding response OmpR family regulator/class 3 adenylate cyclase